MVDSALLSEPGALFGIRGVMFDVDGCLVLSDRPAGEDGTPLPGAAEAVQAARDAGLPLVVFTNGSARCPEDIAADLRVLGLDVRDDEVLTPAVVAARVMRERHPDGRILAFGGEGLTSPLRAAGVDLVDVDAAISDGPGDVAAIVVGWDTEFGRAKIQLAAEALHTGAALYCTSDAPAFASGGRLNVGVSGFIAVGLQHVSSVSYEVIGKPSAEAMSEIARHLRREPHEIAVVGDDLTLECSMAQRGGALAVLVTTGMTTRAQAESASGSHRPHWVIDSLYDFVAALEAHGSERETSAGR